MRKVKAEIDKHGKVNIEFIGFKGDECANERERLRKVMVDFGVMLDPENIQKKTTLQIFREVTEEEKAKMSLRR